MRPFWLCVLGVFLLSACGKGGLGAVCGNGKKDDGEDCDYGPKNDGSERCRTDCTFKRCGDGVVDLGKAIDTNNDGLGDVPEACDPGVVTDPPCRADCRGFASCGNGVVDPPEGCDTGPNRSDTAPGACRLGCQRAACGDGVVDPGEECDDQNDVNGDACDKNCTRPRCGNGEVSAPEVCDDGNAIEVDECLPDCTRNECHDGLDARQLACFGFFSARTRLSITLENRPNGVTVGDFDGDGRNDLAATMALSSNVDVYLRTGGTFSVSSSWNIAAFPVGIVTAELDGAGRADIGVLSTAVGGSTTTAMVNLNRPGLVDPVDFERLTRVDPLSGAGQLAVAELQPDGGQALVFTGAAQLGIARVVETSGRRSTALHVRGVFTTPRLLVACDLDGDGRREVVFSTLTGSLERLDDQPFFTSGALTTTTIEGPAVGVEALACADLDGDGVDELIVLLRPPILRGTVRVLFNSDPASSSPFFERRMDVMLGFSPTFLAASRDRGVVYADSQRIAARRLLNGAFTDEKIRRVFEGPMSIRAIALGRLDVDATTDVAIAAWGGGELIGVLTSSR
jgi:cysteine-rich repeat protein